MRSLIYLYGIFCLAASTLLILSLFACVIFDRIMARKLRARIRDTDRAFAEIAEHFHVAPRGGGEADS